MLFVNAGKREKKAWFSESPSPPLTARRPESGQELRRVPVTGQELVMSCDELPAPVRARKFEALAAYHSQLPMLRTATSTGQAKADLEAILGSERLWSPAGPTTSLPDADQPTDQPVPPGRMPQRLTLVPKSRRIPQRARLRMPRRSPRKKKTFRPPRLRLIRQRSTPTRQSRRTPGKVPANHRLR